MPNNIVLGVHGGPRGSHGAGISLIINGKIKVCIEEERIMRFKNSISCFPKYSLLKLKELNIINFKDIDYIAFSGSTYADMKKRWPIFLDHNFGINAKIFPVNHQVCHAANAYFSSKFQNSIIVSLDGVGDQSSGLIAIGKNNLITNEDFISSEGSVGFFWTLMCQIIGYDGLEEAYKTMGLAAYGDPNINLSKILSSSKKNFFKLNQSFIENKSIFISKHPSEKYYTKKLQDFLKIKPRLPFESLRKSHINLAASAQKHLEDLLLSFFNELKNKYKIENLCFGGGVALNSKFIGYLNDQSNFKNIYIPPNASDSGLALGAAQYCYSKVFKKRPSPLLSVYLGLEYSDKIKKAIDYSGYKYEKYSPKKLSKYLKRNKVIGFYTGRSEYGPRALGHRSIIASPINKNMKNTVNKKIKFREEFRPFAPIVTNKFFDQFFYRGSANYEYMSATIRAKKNTKKIAPAIVHIDETSRVQEIKNKDDPIYKLLNEFYNLTGCPILLNTSFNLKGEPIVETPTDALRTFASSGLDILVLEKYLIYKK